MKIAIIASLLTLLFISPLQSHETLAANCDNNETPAALYKLIKDLRLALFHDTTDMKEIIPFLKATGFMGKIEGNVDRVIVLRAVKSSIGPDGNPHTMIGYSYVVVFNKGCYAAGQWLAPINNELQDKILKQIYA